MRYVSEFAGDLRHLRPRHAAELPVDLGTAFYAILAASQVGSVGVMRPASTALPEFFPWPPPSASAQATFPAGLLGDRRQFSTVGRVSDMLEAALLGCGFGFDDWAYFSIPAEPDAFGLVTRLEQIDPAKGTPLVGSARWAERVHATTMMSFWQSLTMLSRPKGHYRVFVFVLSKQRTPEHPGDRATMTVARGWTSTGKRFLPEDTRKLTMATAHRLTVRVYDFSYEDKGTSRNISSWPASEHLRSAGVTIGSPGSP